MAKGKKTVLGAQHDQDALGRPVPGGGRPCGLAALRKLYEAKVKVGKTPDAKTK